MQPGRTSRPKQLCTGLLTVSPLENSADGTSSHSVGLRVCSTYIQRRQLLGKIQDLLFVIASRKKEIKCAFVMPGYGCDHTQQEPTRCSPKSRITAVTLQIPDKLRLN